MALNDWLFDKIVAPIWAWRERKAQAKPIPVPEPSQLHIRWKSAEDNRTRLSHYPLSDDQNHYARMKDPTYKRLWTAWTKAKRHKKAHLALKSEWEAHRFKMMEKGK